MDREQLGELLSAYIDGEVDDRQRTLIERLVRENDDAMAMLNEIRRTADAVSSLPRHTAPDSISEFLHDQLEREELLGAAPEPRPRSGERGFPIVGFMATAAMLGIVLIGGFWFLRNGTDDARRIRENVLARAEPRDDAISTSARIRTIEEPSLSRSRRAKRGRGSVAAKRDRNTAAFSDHGSRGSTDPAQVPDSRVVLLERETATAQANKPTRPVEVTMNHRATVGDKMRSSRSLAGLRAHNFAVEPLRLKIVVRNQDRRSAAMDRVTAFLSARGAVDVAKLPPGDDAGKPTQTGFFLRGRSHLNFGEGMSEQLLIRVASRDLDALMEELGRAAPSDGDVSLMAGPLLFQGLGHARATLRRLGPSTSNDEPRRNETVTEQPIVPSRSKEPDNEISTPESGEAWNEEGRDERLLEDLFAAIGLDPGLVDELERATQAHRNPQLDGRADSTRRKGQGKPAPGDKPGDEGSGREVPASFKSPANGRESLVQRRLRSLPVGRGARHSVPREQQTTDSMAESRGQHQSGRGMKRKFVVLVLEFVVDRASPNPAPRNRPIKVRPEPLKHDTDKNPSMN